MSASAKPLLSSSPNTLDYGNVAVKETETLLIAVTNSGPGSVTISRVSSSNSEFKVSPLKLPQVLAAGKSLEVGVIFAPTRTGHVEAQLSFLSNASNPTFKLAVSGAGVTSETVTASPPSLSFGDVVLGGSSTLPVVLTNTRSQSVTLESLQTTGGGFSVTGAKFPLTLTKGERVTLRATFKPRAVGLTGGSSFISGPSLNIPFRGTGTSKPELTISPATLNFGKVAVGSPATLTLGLRASAGSVTVSSISSNNALFGVPEVELPLTVPAGKEVSMNVTFRPKKDGSASGVLSFVSSAVNSLTSEPLSGTGTAPYVSLSWIASSSPQVTGYNVYRSTSENGSLTKINSSLDPDTAYADTTVVPGNTYYYSTTAVNSSGKESAHSERVETVVP